MCPYIEIWYRLCRTCSPQIYFRYYQQFNNQNRIEMALFLIFLNTREGMVRLLRKYCASIESNSLVETANTGIHHHPRPSRWDKTTCTSPSITGHPRIHVEDMAWQELFNQLISLTKRRHLHPIQYVAYRPYSLTPSASKLPIIIIYMTGAAAGSSSGKTVTPGQDRVFFI
jgi:hypothetical protein